MTLKKTNSCFACIKTGSININNKQSVFKKLSEFQNETNFFTVFSLKPIASIEHIIFAIKQTISAIENKTNYCNKKEIELLLHLTGTHKINKALKLMELKKGKNQVALIGIGNKKKELKKQVNLIAKKISFKEEKNAIEKNLKKNKAFIQKTFKVKEKINALNDLNKKKAFNELVLEKIALIEVSK